MNALSALRRDLVIAVIFFTRIPLRHDGEIGPSDLSRALRCLPLVGLLVGLIAALAAYLAVSLGAPSLLAALIAVGASILATGCFHEDGLTDLADGFGGAFERQRKLEIMKDSRTGSYGAAALILSISIRAAALAPLIEIGAAWLILPAAHALARSVIPALMATTPQASATGLASYHEPPGGAVLWSALVGGAAVVLLFAGLPLGLWMILAAALSTLFLRWLTLRQIQGYTGDVLGAAEQLAEMAVLAAAAAYLA
jgi:adenosylcobinamide-GDP ribazoletransferase